MDRYTGELIGLGIVLFKVASGVSAFAAAATPRDGWAEDGREDRACVCAEAGRDDAVSVPVLILEVTFAEIGLALLVPGADMGLTTTFFGFSIATRLFVYALCCFTLSLGTSGISS